MNVTAYDATLSDRMITAALTLSGLFSTDFELCLRMRRAAYAMTERAADTNGKIRYAVARGNELGIDEKTVRICVRQYSGYEQTL